MDDTKKKSSTSRLSNLLKFDRSYHCLLPDVVIGLDEVGRGCLAGPVVAAAVSLPEVGPRSALAKSLSRLNDSKLVPPEQREELALLIKEVSQWSICEASVQEIEDLNILQASLLAMKRARQSLKTIPRAVLLIDGNMPVPGLGDPQITVIKGDSQSASIAAASIIAKVHRDALMTRLSVFFPEYQWQRNKGYRSPDHFEAIARLGLTPFHRKAFIHDRPLTSGQQQASQLEFQEGLRPAHSPDEGQGEPL